MTRLIDADALKKSVEELVVGGAERLKDYYKNGSKSEENSWIGGIYDAWELIDNAPTVTDVIPNEEGYEMYSKGYTLGKEKGKNERPQGKWIEVEPHQSDLEEGIDYREECSICHEPNRHYGLDKYYNISFVTYYKTNFCPNCGADMREDRQ